MPSSQPGKWPASAALLADFASLALGEFGAVDKHFTKHSTIADSGTLTGLAVLAEVSKG